jgi:hypothetical protein
MIHNICDYGDYGDYGNPSYTEVTELIQTLSLQKKTENPYAPRY